MRTRSDKLNHIIFLLTEGGYIVGASTVFIAFIVTGYLRDNSPERVDSLVISAVVSIIVCFVVCRNEIKAGISKWLKITKIN